MKNLIIVVLVCVVLECVLGQDGLPVDVCTLPSDVGKCKGHVTRYYFNTKTTHCEEFIFGGCGGNKNNFESVFECQKTCGQTMPSDTVGIGMPLH